MLCEKCRDPIDVTDVLPCQCGQAYQTAEGWEAQGLFEDVLEADGKTWTMVHHSLAPELCEKEWDDGKREPVAVVKFEPTPTTALTVVNDGTRPGDADAGVAPAAEVHEDSVAAADAAGSAGRGVSQACDPCA